MALVVGLGIMGVGYSAWLDAVSIDTNLGVGTWGIGLSNPVPGSANTTMVIPTIAATATGEIPPAMMNVTLNVARPTNTSAAASYYGTFLVTNTGTVPVKIKDILKVGPGVLTIINGVAVGDVIDPGVTKLATVTMLVSENGPYAIQITFIVVPCNQ